MSLPDWIIKILYDSQSTTFNSSDLYTAGWQFLFFRPFQGRMRDARRQFSTHSQMAIAIFGVLNTRARPARDDDRSCRNICSVSRLGIQAYIELKRYQYRHCISGGLTVSHASSLRSTKSQQSPNSRPTSAAVQKTISTMLVG